jgi:hypothetical protein
MNELKAIKQWSRSIPAMTQETEDAAMARLRQAIAESAAPRREGRRPARLSWRLAGAGGFAMAVVLAAGVVVAQNVGTDHKSPGAVSAPRAVPVANTQSLVDQAVQATATQPYVAPRPHQWVYDKSVNLEVSSLVDPKLSAGPSIETWTRGDGKVVADYTPPDAIDHPGKLEMFPTKSHSIDLTTLPTDQGALLNWAYTYPTASGQKIMPGYSKGGLAFTSLEAVLSMQPPPRIRSAVFRALGAIPGVTTVGDVTDAVGRPGIALAIDQPGMEQRIEIILAPKTYLYLGDRDVMLAGNELGLKGGTVYSVSAATAHAIVGKPGERP